MTLKGALLLAVVALVVVTELHGQDHTTQDTPLDLTTGAAPPPERSSRARSTGKTDTRLFRTWGSIVLEVLGIILNVLTLVVLSITPLKKTTTGVYLMALAVADILALIAEIIRWGSSSTYYGLHWMDDHNWLCKLTNHLRYGSRLWSSLLTVVITVERFLAIAFPLKVGIYLTKAKAYIIICLSFLASYLLTVYSSYVFESLGYADYGHDGCFITPENLSIYNTMNWGFSRAFGELVTSILVFIFTTLIILHLIRARSFRSKGTQSDDVAAEKAAAAGSSQDMQVTIMLILVAIAFFVLRAPYTITHYIYHNRKKIWIGDRAYMNMVRANIIKAYDITYVLYTLNHGINFFLYSLSGSKFRGYLRDIFCKPLPGKDSSELSRNRSTRVTKVSSKIPLTNINSVS